MNASDQKYWILTADMGYGHQRATDPFAPVAHHRIINMNSDDFTPAPEQKYWQRILRSYEFLSRSGRIPIIGRLMQRLLNLMLRIPEQETEGDHSRPTWQVRMLKLQINRGLCRGVMNKIRSEPLPVVTSFYAPAIAADMAGIRDVYCIICDSDLNRVWVPGKPEKSYISYFVPCQEAADRLSMYGVPEHRMLLTGFPLHPDLLGDENLSLAQEDFCERLRRMQSWSKSTVQSPDFCGEHKKNQDPVREVLTISFAVGGAGAQAEWAERILRELKKQLEAGRILIRLIAGTRPEVRDYFLKLKKSFSAANVEVVFEVDKNAYFKSFNRAMRSIDLLITKPSEISFYAGLGIPVLMTPPIGSQEEYNRRWLLKNQAGTDLPKSDDLAGWLLERLEAGEFLDMALNGFNNIQKTGYYKILRYLRLKHGRPGK